MIRFLPSNQPPTTTSVTNGRFTPFSELPCFQKTKISLGFIALLVPLVEQHLRTEKKNLSLSATCEELLDNLVRLGVIRVCRHGRLGVVLEGHGFHPLPAGSILSLSSRNEKKKNPRCERREERRRMGRPRAETKHKTKNT